VEQYHDLLRRVFEEGEEKGSRAVLASTGKKPRTRSIFGYQCRYDLREGFPIVTTKFVPFRQVAAELIWFLRGESSLKFLHEHGVHIWDQWGGPGKAIECAYGSYWRRWLGWSFSGDSEPIDQFGGLLINIRTVKEDPEHHAARRLILTAWDPKDNAQWRPGDAPLGCHTLSQFSVTNGRLSCHLYQRSADLFLGVPWNIACYALLTHLVARLAGLEAHEFIHSFGDAHIYENHFDAVAEQLKREPYPLPTLEIDGSVQAPFIAEALSPDQFRLVGYRNHPKLSGEVAI
jgi:thymidylate synthase